MIKTSNNGLNDFYFMLLNICVRIIERLSNNFAYTS